jgi:hypothetical protein
LSAIRRDRHKIHEHTVDKTQVLYTEDIPASTSVNRKEGMAAGDDRVLTRRKVVAAEDPFFAGLEVDVDDLRAAFGEEGVQVDRGDRHPWPWWRREALAGDHRWRLVLRRSGRIRGLGGSLDVDGDDGGEKGEE